MPNHHATAAIIGRSKAIRLLRDLVMRIAPFDLPVLIQGPTGSGKELVAEALHAASGRSGKLVSLNVCAVAEPVFESALFGHVRGSFTGATADRLGYLAEAHKGTLFLDEIGGLPVAAQVKLLRAVETGVYRPVGATADRRSDFRVVSATNDSIDELVSAGLFRADLAHRLQGFAISVPPLRERRDDIPVLVEYFARSVRCRAESAFSQNAIQRLQEYDWPGNVRELRNVTQRLIAFAGGASIHREDVNAALKQRPRQHAHKLADRERDRLSNALARFNGDTARVADHLGVHRATVYRRMRRLGIERGQSAA